MIRDYVPDYVRLNAGEYTPVAKNWSTAWVTEARGPGGKWIHGMTDAVAHGLHESVKHAMGTPDGKIAVDPSAHHGVTSIKFHGSPNTFSRSGKTFSVRGKDHLEAHNLTAQEAHAYLHGQGAKQLARHSTPHRAQESRASNPRPSAEAQTKADAKAKADTQVAARAAELHRQLTSGNPVDTEMPRERSYQAQIERAEAEVKAANANLRYQQATGNGTQLDEMSARARVREARNTLKFWKTQQQKELWGYRSQGVPVPDSAVNTQPQKQPDTAAKLQEAETKLRSAQLAQTAAQYDARTMPRERGREHLAAALHEVQIASAERQAALIAHQNRSKNPSKVTKTPVTNQPSSTNVRQAQYDVHRDGVKVAEIHKVKPYDRVMQGSYSIGKRAVGSAYYQVVSPDYKNTPLGRKTYSLADAKAEAQKVT